MKKWQDKTDEEVRLDVRKMVIEEWDKESQAANDCIVEILESYMEFVDIMEKTIHQYAKLPDTINAMFTMLLSRTRNQWLPLLNQAKKMQNPQKSKKKTA